MASQPFFCDEGLVEVLPTKRAAYSDRTAWLMAEFCRLVYEPLPEEVNAEAFVAEIKQLVQKGCADDELGAVLSRAMAAGQTGLSPVEKALEATRFRLVAGFCRDGTEAVLIRLDPTETFEGMLVLAFRGTERSLDDLRTDVRFSLSPAPGGGRVHSGFLEAFEKVEGSIRAAINQQGSLPLYITGHSLGGALAVLATRYLESECSGATYTFGCPRVADAAFFRRVKMPIYRVVNCCDAVTPSSLWHAAQPGGLD